MKQKWLRQDMQPGARTEVFLGRWVASFPLSMSLEPPKELLNPLMAHVVPSEQVSVNQQRAAWLRATGEGTALCSEGYHPH